MYWHGKLCIVTHTFHFITLVLLTFLVNLFQFYQIYDDYFSNGPSYPLGQLSTSALAASSYDYERASAASERVLTYIH